MRKADYIRRAKARVARSEAAMNASVLRAFDRHMRLLQTEATEMRIRLDRERKGVR